MKSVNSPTIFMISLLLLFSISCSKESSAPTNHENSKVESAEAYLSTKEALDAKAHLGTAAERGTLLAIWQRRLQPSVLENELRNGTQNQREYFFKLSQEVLQAVQSMKPEVNGEPDEVRITFLKAFKNAVIAGCNEDLEGCRYLRLFRQNPATIALLLESIEHVPAPLRESYTLIRLAHVFLNQKENPKLSKLYLINAPAYEKLLSESVQKTANPLDKKRLEAHREVIDQLLIDLASSTKSQIVSPETIQKLASEYEVWDFGRTRSQASSMRDRILLSLTAQRLFKGDELPKQISKLESAPNSVWNRFSSAMSTRPKIAESLGIQGPISKSFSSFLLENLWMKNITAEEARIFWDKSLEGKSDQERSIQVQQMKQDLLNYARVRLLTTSKEVNQILIDFFGREGRFTTTDAFQEALKESVRGQIIWSDAITRLEGLNTFHNQNFRSYGTSDPLTKEITLFFAGIDRNIKLTSTYPSMLVMCYHLARLKFSLKILTWFGVFEIKAGKILEWFFNGELSPWLPYGSDKSAISKSEIPLVFHYAAELGLLEAGGVDVGTLFQMMNEQMLGSLREDVNQINRAFRTKFEASPRVLEFKQICEEQRLRNINGIKTLASTRMPIVNLEHYALMGFPQGGGGNLFLDETFHEAWSFWEAERQITKMRFDDNLEILRLELTPKIEMLELYRDLTKSHLDRHNVSSRDQALSNIDSQIQPLKKLRQETYGRIFKIHFELSNCSESLLLGEVAAESHVIRGLMAHFKNVHRAMKERRKLGLDGLAHEFNYSGKIAITGLEQHEKLLGYSTSSYRMSRIQTLLLIANILQNGFQDDLKKVGPIRDKNSIIVPDRIQNFPQSLRERELSFPWRESEEEFISHGIELIFNHRDHILSWADRANRQIAFVTRLESLVALVKAGPQETPDGMRQLRVPELMKSHLKMLRALEPDEAMTYVLNTTSRFRLPYLEVVLADYAWSKGSREWLGLFDYTYEKLASDKLGDLNGDDNQQRRGASRVGPQEDLKGHKQAIRSLGEPALRIPHDTMKLLSTYYSRRVDQQIAFLNEVLAESKRLEKLRSEQPQSFPSWRLYTNRPPPQVPVLGASAVDRVDGELREMARASSYQIPQDYEAAVKAH
jgi:hypothetical protein